MKFTAAVIIAGIFTVACAGCAWNASAIEALSKDNATFCAKVTSIYGTATFARTNITSGSVKCDGLEVTNPGGTTVPVTITPVAPVK